MRILAVLAITVTVLAAVPAHAHEKIRVVATFPILADMVTNLGAGRVHVLSLVKAGSDPHVFQPKPADVASLKNAQIVVMNGLGFEGWIERMIKASGFSGKTVVATTGVDVLKPGKKDRHEDHKEHGHKGHKDHGHEKEHDHDKHGHKKHGHHGHAHHGHSHEGGVDPHAWQSLKAARHYVDAITAGLIAADPAGEFDYLDASIAYLAKIEALEKEMAGAFAGLSKSQRTVVTSHDAFGYLARDFGLTFLSPQGLSTEAEPSAKQVARLIRQIRKRDIRAVFIESISDARVIKQITAETGAKVGGTLYSDSLSPEGGPAATYLDLMRHNLKTLAAALKGS